MANRGEVATIAVVGAGTMGRGIIQLAAEAGLAVIVHDTAAGAAGNAVAFVGRVIGRPVEKGRLRRGQAAAATGRITLAEGLAELAPADIVVEAIIERLDAKQALFRELEGIVGDDCILATNTSSLPVT